jgi:DNA-directed RNA polymerase specialized sigma24 family protein
VVQQARRKLGGRSHGAAGGEDVAQSAFKSFFRGVEGRRFADLGNRNELWQLLMMLVERKAFDLTRRETSQKRGGGKVAPLGTVGADKARGREPPPDVQAEIAENVEVRLNGLGDDVLRAVAVGKLAGYTHAEIAEQLKCTVSTVERKVALIRDAWRKELADER